MSNYDISIERVLLRKQNSIYRIERGGYMLFYLVKLLVAFGGGVFAASIGPMYTFILVGVVATAGSLVTCAGIAGANELLVSNLAFGPFLAPCVAFQSGVAASAYARKKGYTENGQDIGTALFGLGRPDVLLVGGIFGVIGFIVCDIVNYIFSLTPFYTDNVALTIIILAVVVRFIFGERGMLSAPDKKSYFSKGRVLGNTLVVGIGYSLAVSGVYVFLAMQGYAEQLSAYHFLIFGLCGVGLIFAAMGQSFYGWHHIGLIAAEAVMCGWSIGLGPVGALLFGTGFGLISTMLGDFCTCLMNTDVDSHIDSPSFAIFICTFIISVVYALA